MYLGKIKKSDRVLYNIKQEMGKYQRAFDISMKQRKLMECFKDGTEERYKQIKKLNQIEERCVELDERINLLFMQYLKNKNA